MNRIGNKADKLISHSSFFSPLLGLFDLFRHLPTSFGIFRLSCDLRLPGLNRVFRITCFKEKRVFPANQKKNVPEAEGIYGISIYNDLLLLYFT